MGHFDIKHSHFPVIFAAEYGLLSLCYACEINLNVLRPVLVSCFSIQVSGRDPFKGRYPTP